METGFFECICIHGIKIRVSESEGISHSPRGTPPNPFYTRKGLKVRTLTAHGAAVSWVLKETKNLKRINTESNWNDIEIFNINLLENLWAKLALEKAEEPEIKLPASTGSWKKQVSSRKTSICFIDYAKAFDCVDHNKLWKILKEMGIPNLPLEKSVCRPGSNS